MCNLLAQTREVNVMNSRKRLQGCTVCSRSYSISVWKKCCKIYNYYDTENGALPLYIHTCNHPYLYVLKTSQFYF